MFVVEEVGKWLLFFVGAAALVPSAAALLRRRIVSVSYRVSVSTEADWEQFAEKLKSLPPNELVAQFQNLIRTLEKYAENESDKVSSLINKIIIDSDKLHRRDLLIGQLGWLVSALCGLGLLIQRSELSFVLALIWCGLTLVILILQGLRSMRMESGAGEASTEFHRKSTQ